MGDAMDFIEGLRFHTLGRQWQMLYDTVAARLRVDAAPDAAPGGAALAGAVLARLAPAFKPGLEEKWSDCAWDKRSLAQAVRTVRMLVCLLGGELQAKTGETRDKASVLKRLQRERAAGRATERGASSLAGGFRCAVQRNIGHVGADAVVARA